MTYREKMNEYIAARKRMENMVFGSRADYWKEWNEIDKIYLEAKRLKAESSH